MTTNPQQKTILTPIFKPLLPEENSNHEKDSSYLRPNRRCRHRGVDVGHASVRQKDWFRQIIGHWLRRHGAVVSDGVLWHPLVSRQYRRRHNFVWPRVRGWRPYCAHHQRLLRR